MQHTDCSIRPGDQVKLNSGDLRMIVRNIITDYAQCIWFDTHQHFNELDSTDWLPLPTLTRIGPRANAEHIIRLGDKVELNSGGPKMTVCEVYTKTEGDSKHSYTKCVYITLADKLIFVKDIPARGLKRI